MAQKTLFDAFATQQLTRKESRDQLVSRGLDVEEVIAEIENDRRKPIKYQETSREALSSFAPDSGTLDALILEALLKAGKNGLIDQEIEERIGRSHQAVSGNRRHLVEKKIVRETKLRGRTSSGRSAIRWVHRDFYDAAIHQVEKD